MKVTPVKGTNDYLPKEVEIRDYLQQKILEVYLANGFEHIITPVIEDIENFISDYDVRINEAVLGINDKSEKRVLSFNLTLRSPDISKIESEIQNIVDILL